MGDPSTELLIKTLSGDAAQLASSQHLLLVADEHFSYTILNRLQKLPIILLTNRFDVAQAADAAKINYYLNDFDFTEIKQSFTAVYYRVSKEKPIVHHIINQSIAALTTVQGTEAEGRLILTGEKSEGIKGYGDRIKKNFKLSVDHKKLGNQYLVQTHIAADNNQIQNLLDTKNYNQTQLITHLTSDFSTSKEPSDIAIYSKPGVYGWNKVDQGSQFLATHLKDWLTTSFKTPPKKMLDLGCGYGYLSIALWKIIQSLEENIDVGTDLELDATDNNIASVALCKANFEANNIEGNCIVDDCGSQLKPGYQAIICNPPFHQGFQIDDELSLKFLKQISHLLGKNGKAIIVVNEFLAIEKKAQPLFSAIHLIAKNKTFKLLELTK